MEFSFINHTCEQIDMSIKSGLIKRGKVGTAIDVERYKMVETPKFPDLSTQEQKDKGMEKWKEFWDSFSMVLLGYLDAGFQKCGCNQPGGRCDPKVFEFIMTKAGAERFIATPSRRKKIQVMVQYKLKETLAFFQKNVPQNPGRIWLNIAPGFNVPCDTRKRFTELVIRQNVATNLIEFDYKYVCEYYDNVSQKWLATW